MTTSSLLKWHVDLGLCLSLLLVYPILFTVATLWKLYEVLFRSVQRKSFAGEVAVVTGAGGGLGKCIAIELAKLGCHVAVVDVNGEAAQSVAKLLITEYKVQAKAYKVDISNYEAIRELNEQIVKDLGAVTVLINNAGILTFSDMFDPDWREVQQMINVNLTAHFWTLKVFLPKMKELKKGHIVAISSIAGLMPLAHHGEYTSTKYAVRGLMNELRLQLRVEQHNNIKATTVYPAFLRTNAKVLDVTMRLGVESVYPAITGEEMAECIVRGMRENKREVVMLHTALMYRLLELLPVAWRDLALVHVYKPFLRNYNELRDIYK